VQFNSEKKFATIAVMKDVICECGEVLAQTDGKYLYVAGLIINQDEDRQSIGCKCGRQTVWERSA
jgi:hypothetical protein